MHQLLVALDQILPADDLASVQPPHRFWIQAITDLSHTSGFLIVFDLSVHLGDGVFDALQGFAERPVVVCVGCKEREINDPTTFISF